MKKYMICLFLFAAVSAHAEQHGFAAVERKALAFVQLRGEPCGSLLGQVKGLSALGAGHVQYALARRSIGILIEYLACAGSGTAAHFPLGFKCRKIAVNCAQADFFSGERLRDLPGGQMLVGVFAQIVQQRLSLLGDVFWHSCPSNLRTIRKLLNTGFRFVNMRMVRRL